MPEISGIDVSKWQGVINWPSVKAAGIQFAFIRASVGFKKDKFFPANWTESRGAGLVRGAYHYLLAGQDAGVQAELFASLAAIQPGDLPPVLDVEAIDNEQVSGKKVVQAVKTWVGVVEERTGRKPIIYTNPAYWNQLQTDDFGSSPLWVAHWGVHKPTLPRGWETWTFWQYSEKGQVSGIQGFVDLDRFNGSEELFLRLLQHPAPRLIVAFRKEGAWAYEAVAAATFVGDHFEVSPRDLAQAIGRTGGSSNRVPVRDAVAALGWQTSFATQHLADPEDPRVYLFVA
jgi:lysozyme